MARVAAGLALLLVACQAVPSIATPAPSAVVAGGTLRVAIPAEVTVLDPWNADSASQVATRQIFETLVTVDPATGAVAAGLASSWQMANDGASWTFALRGGISFADGTPFDAATVVASFDRGRGTRAYRLLFDEPSAISRVVALDGKTVRFELRAPFGPFLVHLAAPQAGIARGTSGTGPFTAAPDALAPDGSITLRRNEAYWLRTSGGRTLPYLDGLVLRPVRDAAARFAELRAGRVDLALELPVAQATAARSDPNLALLTRPSAASATLGIDVAAPPFDQPDARRAVAMAIDRGALSGPYYGLGHPASQVIPSGTLGYDDSVVDFAPLDPSGARRLLSDAHIAVPINVDLAYPAFPTMAYPDPQRIAQSIAADLAKVGIIARLRAVDAAALRDVRGALALETTLVGLDPDDVFWPLFGTDDPRDASLIVGLLRKARMEADPSKRAELYKQVSKLARAEVTRVPLLIVDRAIAASARVAGYVAETNASFGTVWLRP